MNGVRDYVNDYVNDYIIVGAGPCGLTLSYLLGKAGKKCILIDKNTSVGGCHRVNRLINSNLFTEHGPRIYSNSYKNTISLLEDMGYSFSDFFTPYIFSILTIGGQSLENFTFTEKLKIGYEYFKLLFNNSYGKDISVKSFTENNNFSDRSKDYLNRLCRLTDGAGYERYSLNEFLQLINQELLYSLHQPKSPNDEGLFNIIEKEIRKTGNVKIILGVGVERVIEEGDRVILEDGSEIKGDKIILAVPPRELYRLLPQEIPIDWVKKCTYDEYIPITYHWNRKIKLPKVWGFPKSDWGVIYIVLTDYMKFNEPDSVTVISTCISMTDKVSSYTGKTANQTINKDELKKEVLRQIFEKTVPKPTHSLLNSGVWYNKEKKMWMEEDSAFISGWNSYPIKQESTRFNNIYNVGTHNGESSYAFTSLESAITNAIVLYNKLEKDRQFSLSYPFTLRKLIFIVIIILIILVVYIKLK